MKIIINSASDSLIIERVQRLILYFTGRVLKINHPAHDYTPVLHELKSYANLKFLQIIIDGT